MPTYVTSTPFTIPSAAPTTQADSAANASGSPLVAAMPATTLLIAKIDPTEMSISPAMMTSVPPSATASTAALASSRSVRFDGEK